MFKLYRKSQEAQLQWIHDHPVQFVALNAALVVGFVGYMEWQERRYMRKVASEIRIES